jgi:hypothetical protein
MKKTYYQTLNTLPAFAESGDIRRTWAQAHTMAIGCPRDGYEKALVEMLSGWLRYADAVQDTWGAGVGKDYVLGPCWAQIGAGLRGLLNGDIGRMDGGTLDGLLCRTLEAEGFDPDRF